MRTLFPYFRIERDGRGKKPSIPASNDISRFKNRSAENGKLFGGHCHDRFTSLRAYPPHPNPRYPNLSPDDRTYRASVRPYTCFRKVLPAPRRLENGSRSFQTAEPDNCRYTHGGQQELVVNGIITCHELCHVRQEAMTDIQDMAPREIKMLKRTGLYIPDRPMFLRTALHIGGNMDIIHRVLGI